MPAAADVEIVSQVLGILCTDEHPRFLSGADAKKMLRLNGYNFGGGEKNPKK